MHNNLIKKVLVEFIGTFIFLGVIVAVTKKSVHYDGIETAFAAGLALTVAILFGGAISGGYFNPAVSIMMLFKENPQYGVKECVLYCLAQILGGIAAFYFIK